MPHELSANHSPDECGWSCKFHNLTNRIKTEFAERRERANIRKAEAYGYENVDEFKKAVKEAQEKGREKAQKERRENLTKGLEINSYLKAGGGRKTKPKSDILNALLGNPVKTTRKPTRKRRKAYAPKAPVRKKSITKWVVVGGVAYPTKSNTTTRRTTTRKGGITPSALMRWDRRIWDKHGWRNADDVNYTTYRKEVNDEILKNYNVSKRDLDALTFENHHSLRHVIEKNKTKTRPKRRTTARKRTTRRRTTTRKRTTRRTTRKSVQKSAFEFFGL